MTTESNTYDFQGMLLALNVLSNDNQLRPIHLLDQEIEHPLVGLLKNCRICHRHHLATLWLLVPWSGVCVIHVLQHSLMTSHTHTHTHTHSQRHSPHAVLYTYSQIATLYRVSSSKGCRVHELQCNMCRHSNTFVFASISNLWLAINHSISPTLPPTAALWRRVTSFCWGSGHVSVTHKPLQHTHLPHISRGECLFCSTQQILTYSTCTPH